MNDKNVLAKIKEIEGLADVYHYLEKRLESGLVQIYVFDECKINTLNIGSDSTGPVVMTDSDKEIS